MNTDLDLAALRAFRMVLSEGSFTAAALRLRLPKSTLSKRIADLEAQLGLRLIERSSRALRPTREGLILAERAEKLLAEADDIRRALGESDGQPRGHLRIAVPMVIGLMTMGKMAAAFRATHPQVTLEVHFLDRLPDLLAEGFDGALTAGPLPDSAQITRLMMQTHGILVAAPGMAGLDQITHPNDLSAQPLVGLAAPWRDGWPLARGTERLTLDLQPALMLGSHLAVRDAVIAGAGIALLPRLIAYPEIDNGRLVQILPDWGSQRKPLYFVYPSAHSVTARLRAFIDFLAEALREQPARR
jgi:DNA-binding transcriptional LysR family regulator